MTKTKIIPLVGLMATGMTTWVHAAEDCSAFSAFCTVVYKEAEAFETRDEFDSSANPLKPGWFNVPSETVPTTGINYPNNLVDPSQAASRQPDPDPNSDPSHATAASGGAYLELLPDTFVDKDVETKVDGVNFWETPDDAPKIHYKVNFPEDGRYHVYVRANKTGSEDNGIHVGINGTWPDSGRQMQWCGGSNLWRWRGRQRNSGNFPPEGEDGHTSCGAEDTVWLDVPSAGEHTISFAGREDGFEIDRIAFVKNYQPTVRVCRPHHEREADIDCTKPHADRVITVQSPTEAPSIQIGQTQDIVYRFANNSENYTVSDTRLFLKLPNHLSFEGSSSGCQQNTDHTRDEDNEIECHVSAAIDGSNHFSHRITVRAVQEGTGTITSRSTSLEHNYNDKNDSPELAVTVTPVPQAADVRAFVASDLTSLRVGDEIKLSARVSNVSPDSAASDVHISVPMLEAFEFVSADTGCSLANNTVRCSWATLAANATETREIALRAKASGSVTFNATAGAAVDADSTNNAAQISVTVAASPGQPTTEEPTTEEPTTGQPTTEEPTVTPTPSGGGGGALGLWGLLGLGLVGMRRRGH